MKRDTKNHSNDNPLLGLSNHDEHFRKRSILRFFLFSSGTNIDLFKEVPSNFVKSAVNWQAAIGATVVFTGIFASISGGYALSTVFRDNQIATLGFAIFWGLLIYNLDRFIVMSMSSDIWWKRIVQAIPRLLLALVIAFVIARPLELRIFQDEVNEALVRVLEEKIEEAQEYSESRVLESFRQDSLKNAALISQDSLLFAQLNARAERKYQDFLGEISGNSGSGKKGYGDLAKGLEKEYRQLISRRDFVDNKIIRLREEQRALVKALSVELEKARKEAERLTKENYSTSIMARNSALSKWVEEDESKDSFYAVLIITLLFIILETAPILTKLLSGTSYYDAINAKYEQKNKLNELKKSLNTKQLLEAEEQKNQQILKVQEHELKKRNELDKNIINKAYSIVNQQAETSSTDSPENFSSNVFGRHFDWLFKEKEATNTNAAVSKEPNDETIVPTSTSDHANKKILLGAALLFTVMILLLLLSIVALPLFQDNIGKPSLGASSNINPPNINVTDRLDNLGEDLATRDQQIDNSPSNRYVNVDTTNIDKPMPVDAAPEPFINTVLGQLLPSLVPPSFTVEGALYNLTEGRTTTILISDQENIIDKSPTGDASLKLEKGDSIEILERFPDLLTLTGKDKARRYYGYWLRVKTEDGNTGSIFSYYTKEGFDIHCLKVQESMNINPFLVRDKPLNVRIEDYQEAISQTSLDKDDDFKIIERKPELKTYKLKSGKVKHGHWCKVKVNGVEGWIFDYFTYKGLDYYDCLKEKNLIKD